MTTFNQKFVNDYNTEKKKYLQGVHHLLDPVRADAQHIPYDSVNENSLAITESSYGISLYLEDELLTYPAYVDWLENSFDGNGNTAIVALNTDYLGGLIDINERFTQNGEELSHILGIDKTYPYRAKLIVSSIFHNQENHVIKISDISCKGHDRLDLLKALYDSCTALIDRKGYIQQEFTTPNYQRKITKQAYTKEGYSVTYDKPMLIRIKDQHGSEDILYCSNINLILKKGTAPDTKFGEFIITYTPAANKEGLKLIDIQLKTQK